MAEPNADHLSCPSDGQPQWRLPFWMLLALIGLTPVECGCGSAVTWVCTLVPVFPRDGHGPTGERD